MRKYRVNSDLWTVLQDILTGSPEEFDASNMYGRNVKVGMLSDLGRLPDEWRAVWHNDKDNTVYAIWSYLTPIAWRTYRNGRAVWIIPDVRYSVTTTKHQNKVRVALHLQETIESVE
jgi:hypothetical protein